MQSKIYSLIQQCRSCGSPDLRPAYSVEPIPVAGIYYNVTSAAKNIKAPLTLSYCAGCGLVQLMETIHPDIYLDYSFVGNSAASYEKYLKDLAGALVDRWNMRNKDVLEIGANNGVLLKHVATLGNNRVLGIEPSQKLCDDALQNRVNVRQGYFNTRFINENNPGTFHCVVMRHVLEHIDDLNDMLDALRGVIREDGLLILEVPDMTQILDRSLFSNIFHEHLNYFSARSLDHLLSRYGFEAVHQSSVEVHGGSLLAVYQPGGKAKCSEKPIDALQLKNFATEADNYYRFIRRSITDIQGQQKTVHGYGASHRTFILMGNAGLNETEVPVIFDNNPFLHDKRLNGLHSRVLPVQSIAANPSDAMVIFALAHEHEIRNYLLHQCNYRGEILSLQYEQIYGISDNQ